MLKGSPEYHSLKREIDEEYLPTGRLWDSEERPDDDCSEIEVIQTLLWMLAEMKDENSGLKEDLRYRADYENG